MNGLSEEDSEGDNICFVCRKAVHVRDCCEFELSDMCDDCAHEQLYIIRNILGDNDTCANLVEAMAEENLQLKAAIRKYLKDTGFDE